jgi:ABC-type polysaccharide/polyol phosphate export permease
MEGTAPDWQSLAWLSVAGLAAFIFGFAWFYKSRKAFADVL